eukprot:11196672-Lingulodinium_polyedra.AAC.1
MHRTVASVRGLLGGALVAGHCRTERLPGGVLRGRIVSRRIARGRTVRPEVLALMLRVLLVLL